MTVGESAHSRMATEIQLLAEERWLNNALKMIAQQRNSLQIEKLQLKFLLSTFQAKEMNVNNLKDENGTNNDIKPEDIQASLEELTRQKMKLDEQDMDDGFLCNTQELNLNVNPDLYKMEYFNDLQQDYIEEEDDEDDEEDDEGQDSMLNMFIMDK